MTTSWCLNRLSSGGNIATNTAAYLACIAPKSYMVIQHRYATECLIDKIIKDIITNDDKLASIVSICIADSVEWQALRLLTKALFKKKCHVKEILSRIQHDQGGRVSRWEFYNAVTNYVSRSGSWLKPQVDTWLQNKAQKILTTPIAQLTEEWVTVGEKKPN